MYVYLQSEQGRFTVGFYNPAGVWVPESDHPTADAAASRVAWLNGNREEAVDVAVGIARKPSSLDTLIERLDSDDLVP